MALSFRRRGLLVVAAIALLAGAAPRNQLSAQACTYSLSAAKTTVGPSVQAGSVSVTTGPGCPWSASSDAPWLAIAGASGVGNGVVSFTAALHTAGAFRVAQLNIAGQLFHVIQRGRINHPDFDGDGAADIGLFRPSTGEWLIVGSTVWQKYLWGSSLDIAVPGDYDGDGVTDVAVLRPTASAVWYIRRSSSADRESIAWGTAGDCPVPGDYDGDAKTDVAIYRPSTGAWHIRGSSVSATYAWGGGSDVPVPADYDGDGVTDAAVFRASAATWYIRQSATSTMRTAVWGGPGDMPVPGDYDGDGKTDVAIFRPSGGFWFVLGSRSSGVYRWGVGNETPVPADYDGDRVTDLGVFLPPSYFGSWNIFLSATGQNRIVNWGAAGDVALSVAPRCSAG